MRIAIDDGRALDGSAIAIETLPAADQYRLQAEAFSRRVRGEEAPGWGLDDAIAQMRVIDALWRSERSRPLGGRGLSVAGGPRETTSRE